jgi:hypothetical protein
LRLNLTAAGAAIAMESRMPPKTAIASLLIAAAMTLVTATAVLFYGSMWLLAQLLRGMLWPVRLLIQERPRV